MERDPDLMDYDLLSERIMLLCRKLECDHFISGFMKLKMLDELASLIKQRAKLHR